MMPMGCTGIYLTSKRSKEYEAIDVEQGVALVVVLFEE
jgi:hypothetical protein